MSERIISEYDFIKEKVKEKVRLYKTRLNELRRVEEPVKLRSLP